jgi:Flp pilus assembly protein TadD
MKLYEQVLKLQPDNPIALNNLAYLMTERGGDLDLALTYAQRAKQKYPKSLDISDTLGWIYIKKNLTGEAIGIYKELVTAQPQNSTFRYHLAMALFQKGDKPQAKKELQTALKNSPPKEEENKIRDLMARIG